jgi:hypothetical protein
MNNLRRYVFALGPGLLLTALLLPFVPHTARADVVRLRNGEIVKGRPIARLSTDEALVVEDLVTGNVRTFLWSVVERADRDRLLTGWHRKEEALAPVAGQRLTLRLIGAGEQVLRGLLVGATKTHHRLQRAGTVVEIEKARVIDIASEMLDPRDLWSPEQLVARFIERLAKGRSTAERSLGDHLRIGNYASQVGAYEQAAKHLALCAADKSFASAAVAAARLTELRALLAEQDLLGAMRAIRMSIALKSFRKARKEIAALDSHAIKAGSPLAVRIESLKAHFEEKRRATFTKAARRDFLKVIHWLTEQSVHERSSDFADHRSWARKHLADQAFAGMAKGWTWMDDVSPEEARVFWANRKRSTWSSVSYGSGTFIVEPAKRAPPKRRAKKRDGAKGPGLRLPTPPTRDQWWAQASKRERTHWIMARFVENADLFDVDPAPIRANCPRCHGKGTLSLRTPDGSVHRYLCTRCAGSQRDRRVKFR